MKVGNRVFSGKGAREEAAKALTLTILTWRDDQTLQPRGAFRGFEILSRGKSSGFGTLQEDERIPEVLVRGRATYSANLNASNPVGTAQSIEHALRNLDKLAVEQQSRVTRIEKELADYRVQADRPFEHEDRLKQLQARQAELNCLLDLDKGEQHAVPVPDKDDPEIERTLPMSPRCRDEVARMAAAYMRESGTAIREMPISERTPPQAGQVSARVVARDEAHIAFAAAANSFFIVPSASLGRDLQIGERLSLRFHRGRASIDNERDRGR
jgi:hypothetical protein